MDNTKKIIIVCLVGLILALGAAIGFTLMKEPVKTVELIENGTTVEVPESTILKNHSEVGMVYETEKNTTVMGIDNNNLGGALASKILSGLLVDKGEKQDNGLYKLDKKSIMELGDQLGLEYDENNIKEIYVGIKHNNTVNQTVFIIGADQNEMVSIMDSIHWKKGVQSNNTVNATTTSGSDEKTYPFYADDGSIVGYYHVGDVVEHYDGLYQLKSNGQWVYIGLSKNAQHANNQVSPEDDIERDDEDPADFQDTFEDPYDIEYEDGGNVETTTG